MTSYMRLGPGVLLALLVLLAATVKLESAPPLWWDEGWTLSVARNWTEQGHYGRLLAGKPAPPGLEAHFPVTAVVSFSFRLLGVGVYQARAPGVFFILGTLAIVYYLACRLYNRRIAVTTLLVMLFMSPPYRDLHPILMGRQVLGEMPMMFYLLAGYAFFLSAQDKSLWAMPLAVFFLGCSSDYKSAGLAILASVATSAIASSAVHTTLETRRFTCRWAGLFAHDRAIANMVAAASIRAHNHPGNSDRGAVLYNGIGGSTSCASVRFVCNFAVWNSNACRALL